MTKSNLNPLDDLNISEEKRLPKPVESDSALSKRIGNLRVEPQRIPVSSVSEEKGTSKSSVKKESEGSSPKESKSKKGTKRESRLGKPPAPVDAKEIEEYFKPRKVNVVQGERTNVTRGFHFPKAVSFEFDRFCETRHLVKSDVVVRALVLLLVSEGHSFEFIDQTLIDKISKRQEFSLK